MSVPATSIPERLGEFRVVGLLGEGAFGTVYEAEREVAAGAEGPRRVALKVLRADLLPGEKQRKQFMHEATLLAGVDHPGVVKLLGFGLLPDDRPYLAMERLEGETLAAALARGPLPAARALTLFAQLAEAIGALHARGLVHRDVKPENVYLVEGGVRAVLFDFGIAKGEGAPVSTMTQDGAVRGTPAYMAPERFFGAPASVASEVYELAVCLYAMLAGRLPWADAGDPETRLQPAALSTVGVSAPPELEAAIMRALSTRAEKRPASVRELAAQVAAATAGAGSGGGVVRRTMDLPAESAPVVLPGGGGGLAAQPTTGGSGRILATAEKPRRSKATLALVLAGLAVAGGVGAVVGRMAWKDAGGAADAAPEPTPVPPEPEPVDPRPMPPPGPRREAKTRRVPAEVWKHHAPDTAVLVGLSWTQVLESAPVKKIVAKRKGYPAPKWYARLLRGCGFDPVSELEWLSFGVGSDPAAKDLDLIVAGRWTRDELEPCLQGLLSGPLSSAAMERHGRTTALRYAGRGYTLGWLDEHTVLFSTRAGADRAWVEARLDAADGGAKKAAALEALRAPAGEAGTLWIVARPAGYGNDTLAPGVPTPEAMFGAVTLDEDLAGTLTWRYPGVERAEALMTTAGKALEDAKQDPVTRMLLGKTKISRDGKDVKLVIALDAATTEAFLEAMVGGLAVQLEAL